MKHFDASFTIEFMARHEYFIQFWMQHLHMYDFYGLWFHEFAGFVCGVHDSLCLWLETFLWATTSEYEDPDRFQVYMGHTWKGVSMKMMYHLA